MWSPQYLSGVVETHVLDPIPPHHTTSHSSGHALYEQGRNLGPEWEGLPVNSALSMGIHESQSLFWERMVSLTGGWGC